MKLIYFLTLPAFLFSVNRAVNSTQKLKATDVVSVEDTIKKMKFSQEDYQNYSLSFGDLLSPNPTLFAQHVFTDQYYNRDFCISPNGDEIYVTLTIGNEFSTILCSVSPKRNEWTPREVAPFSKPGAMYLEPAFSPDGLRLYFASDRPRPESKTNGDFNIWYVERKTVNSSWSEPVLCPEQINSGANEFYPAIGKSGAVYFTSKRKDAVGGEDIFVSYFKDGKYQNAVPLSDSVNSKFHEFNAFVNYDENLIIFTSYGRTDDLGGGDLYYSKKDKNGIWSKATHMGTTVNSAKLDYCPFYYEPYHVLIFTSERTEMLKDLPFPYDIYGLNSFIQNKGHGSGDLYYLKMRF